MATPGLIDTGFDFNSSFLKGALGARQFNQVRAQNAADQMYAKGNAAGAVTELRGAGLNDQANTIEDRPVVQAQAQANLEQRQIGNQQSQVNLQQDQEKAEWEKVAQATGFLRNARNTGQDVGQVYASMKPFLLANGLDEAQYNEIGNQLTTNPGFLDAIHGQALKIVGGDVVNFDTGEVVHEGGSSSKPKTRALVNPDGTTTVYEERVGADGQVSLVPVPLSAPGAAPAPQAAAPAPGLTAADLAQSLVPGVIVTSMDRSPEDNKRVGGAKNSWHMQPGKAVDLIPPPGMTMAQLEQQLKASGVPFTELLNEGDHIHMVVPQDQSAPGQLGPQYRVGGRPNTKPQFRPATAQEKQAAGLDPSVAAQFDTTTGRIDTLGSTKPTEAAKAPAQIAKAYTENGRSVTKLDRAIEAVTKNKRAFGIKNYLGDEVMQRLDPTGVNARAQVANLGSLVIHDRSGAAVTAAEFPRLKPFIPQATDTPEVVLEKLRLFKQEFDAVNAEYERLYPSLNKAGGGGGTEAGGKQWSDSEIEALLRGN